MTDKSNRSVMLDTFLPYRLVNLASNVSQTLSMIYKSEFDITIPEWRVLAQLGVNEKLNAKDIGDICSMDKSKVSRAVKVLEQKRYLLKEKDQQDNRASYLSLTDKGRDIYLQIVPKALDWEKQLISALDASEYRDLMRILDKLDNQILAM